MVHFVYRRACGLSVPYSYCQPRGGSNSLSHCSAYTIQNSSFLSPPPSSTYISHEMPYKFIECIDIFYINQVIYKNDLWANTAYLKHESVPLLYLPTTFICI